MVKFYSPNCGYCRQMVPAYNKLAESLKDLVEVATVDCTDFSNQNLCEKYRIEGFPTLKFFVVQESEREKGKKKKIVLGKIIFSFLDLFSFLKIIMVSVVLKK